MTSQVPWSSYNTYSGISVGEPVLHNRSFDLSEDRWLHGATHVGALRALENQGEALQCAGFPLSLPFHPFNTRPPTKEALFHVVRGL